MSHIVWNLWCISETLTTNTSLCSDPFSHLMAITQGSIQHLNLYKHVYKHECKTAFIQVYVHATYLSERVTPDLSFKGWSDVI